MRLALLVLASVAIVGLGGYAWAQAGGATQSGVAAGDVKARPERTAANQVAGQTKPATKAPPDLEPAKKGRDRDDPLLRLLWLLTGSSRKR